MSSEHKFGRIGVVLEKLILGNYGKSPAAVVLAIALVALMMLAPALISPAQSFVGVVLDQLSADPAKDSDSDSDDLDFRVDSGAVDSGKADRAR